MVATHVTVKIPKDLVKEMDKLLGKHGFRSRGEIAKEAIRKLLANYEKVGKPTLQHFNLDEDGVRILDHDLHLIVDIAFKPKGVWCDYCQTNNCRHIQFALTVPEVQAVIRKKRGEGWSGLPDV